MKTTKSISNVTGTKISSKNLKNVKGGRSRRLTPEFADSDNGVNTVG